MASRRATRPSPSADRTVARCGAVRATRHGRIRPVTLLAMALATTAALLAFVVSPVLAERPAERPGQVGKNWTSTVQDAQPSGKTPSRQSRERQLPADARSGAPIAVQPDVPAGSVPYQP